MAHSHHFQITTTWTGNTGSGTSSYAAYSRDHLLSSPSKSTSIAGSSAAVFRGDGGRELLGDTLRARGAAVEYVACYRRALPSADPAPLLEAWRDGRIDALTVTSSEGLRNLCTLLGADGRALLQATPLFVPHPRIGDAARAAVSPAGQEAIAVDRAGRRATESAGRRWDLSWPEEISFAARRDTEVPRFKLKS